jgi:hypothetical protein
MFTDKCFLLDAVFIADYYKLFTSLGMNALRPKSVTHVAGTFCYFTHVSGLDRHHARRRGLI